MTLEMYHTVFVVCMVMTICLCIISIVFFCVFDIRKIIGIKTGWTLKKSIKELQIVYQEKERETNRINSKESVLPEIQKRLKSEKKEEIVGRTELVTPVSVISYTESLQEKPVRMADEKFQILETKMIIFSNEIIGGNDS